MGKSASSIGERIKQLRGGESLPSFAHRLGVHINTQRRYESEEREPDTDYYRKLTKMGVNVQWVISGTGLMLLSGEQADVTDEMHRSVFDEDRAVIAASDRKLRGMPQFVREQEIEHAASANLVMVPHLGIELGAGPGRFAVKAERNGDLAFRIDLLRELRLNPKDAGLATVRGDSMLEVLHDGDVVLLDRSQNQLREVRSGKCYAFRWGEELLIKYLQRDPSGNLSAISRNAGVFPPISIPRKAIESGTEFELIGRIRSHNHVWD